MRRLWKDNEMLRLFIRNRCVPATDNDSEPLGSDTRDHSGRHLYYMAGYRWQDVPLDLIGTWQRVCRRYSTTHPLHTDRILLGAHRQMLQFQVMRVLTEYSIGLSIIGTGRH